MTNEPSDPQSFDKPLIQCRIVLLPIDKLLGHEQIVPIQVEWLKKNLIKLGYFFRPILVAKNHNVVLDGHHRVEALKEIGGKKIPCIEIEYINNNDITLGTWYPYFTEKVDIKFPEEFKRMDLNWENVDNFSVEILDNPNYGFTLKTKNSYYRLEGTQQNIYAKFLAHFDPQFFEYAMTLDYAIKVVDDNIASFALLRRTLSKEDVIEAATQKKVFAPKTTRHILAYRYQDIKVPLENLY